MSAAFVHGRLLAGLLAVLLVGCESCRAEPAPTASASASTEAPLVGDVYTDLVCPWCFIGTERASTTPSHRAGSARASCCATMRSCFSRIR